VPPSGQIRIVTTQKDLKGLIKKFFYLIDVHVVPFVQIKKTPSASVYIPPFTGAGVDANGARINIVFARMY